jgi:hypothetical protein
VCKEKRGIEQTDSISSQLDSGLPTEVVISKKEEKEEEPRK